MAFMFAFLPCMLFRKMMDWIYEILLYCNRTFIFLLFPFIAQNIREQCNNKSKVIKNQVKGKHADSVSNKILFEVNNKDNYSRRQGVRMCPHLCVWVMAIALLISNSTYKNWQRHWSSDFAVKTMCSELHFCIPLVLPPSWGVGRNELRFTCSHLLFVNVFFKKAVIAI